MTPEIITRSFSNDNFIFDKVFFENIYKLKGHKENGPIVVDIGAHAGYFSFAALTLGARKVYSFEPYIDNFNILLKNCYNPNFIGRFTPYQLGVYTEERIGKFSRPNLVNDIYFDFSSIGLAIKQAEPFYPCKCETLDNILRYFCFDEKIDVLKINLGTYCEREILLWAGDILKTNVTAICGEVTCNDEEFFEFKKQMGIKGFINCISEPEKNGRITFRMSQGNLSENFI